MPRPSAHGLLLNLLQRQALQPLHVEGLAFILAPFTFVVFMTLWPNAILNEVSHSASFVYFCLSKSLVSRHKRPSCQVVLQSY